MIKNIEEWEVETPSGWSNFSGIKSTKKDCYIRLVFSDNTEIKGSFEHRIRIWHSFISLKDMKIGSIIRSKKVIDKQEILQEIELFDLLDVEKNSEYYTNDIISHNCAFVRGMNDIWTSAQPTLSTGGDCIVLSTPNGVGNFFHQQYSMAESGVRVEVGGKFKNFNPIKLSWRLHPDRDEEWETLMRGKMSAQAFAQEHNCVGYDTEVTLLDKNTKNIKISKIGSLYYKEVGCNYRYQILSDKGFVNFVGLQRTKQRSLKIEFDDYVYKDIVCSKDHRFFDKNGEILASQLKIGDSIKSKEGYKKITSIYEHGFVDLFDVLGSENKKYYSNDILSHNCDFLMSGNNVIDMKDLMWYKDNNYIAEPIEKRYLDKTLWIWQKPIKDEEYIIPVDIARGDGSDYSAFHVIRVSNNEQVAEFKGKIPTDQLSQCVVELAHEYNEAYLAPENVGIGHAVCQGIQSLGYKNMYWSFKDTTKLTKENANNFYVDSYNVPTNAVAGFSTNAKTRPLIISRLEEEIRLKTLIFHSKRTYEEATTFIYQNGKAEALDGYHDDLIMSLAIGEQVRYNNINFFGYNSEYAKVMFDHMGKDDQIFEAFSSSKQPNKAESYFQVQVANGKNEDIKWLL